MAKHSKTKSLPSMDKKTGESADTLSSTYALASVGIAAVHTLEAILPEAAADVEEASRKLADRFMMLVQNAVAQENVVRMLLDHISTAEPDTKSEMIKEIRREASILSKNIADVTSDIVVGMQFQDRNTQIIENAALILNQYGRMLKDIRNNIQHSEGMAAHPDVTKTVDDMLSGIRVGEIRKQFMQALKKAKILHSAGHHALSEESDDKDTIELF